MIGVEVQETMVQAAQNNAALNGLDNVSFVAADLTQPIAKKFIKDKVTKILLDPPRAGAFEFLDTIIKIKPMQILYVSCNASTLARDAEYLVTKGYRVLRVSLMDMFPQTSHVETMMLLQRKK
ncbi:methyltransferase domain-containing protein [Marinomonas sp. GJ51-6]|uniref:methyltransferase domain-containing protein n=1 Tax=Marinomonas sp. GJ51-6 TaxID=2992802 RepID=UPI002934AEDD|nr:methyltransferase domain-containing protein [Marinomonas sp. GJ51-6]WOD06814.1 methyltransferase domain-containing protein [Marinomonas sp. GJ51-6]